MESQLAATDAARVTPKGSQKSPGKNTILNVDYLFQVVTDPDILEEESTQVICFENPFKESIYQVTESLQEGLLFEDEGHLFYLDSEYVVQIIEENSFQFKNVYADFVSPRSG